MDNAGASSTVAFLFAGMLFIGGISAVFLNTENVGNQASSAEQDARLLEQQAMAVRDLLLRSPGHAQLQDGTSADWASSAPEGQTHSPADGLVRFGLLEPGTNSISFSKLVNLRKAPYAANATDGLVNYEEARQSLGLLAEDFDFHVRAYPSLKSVQELLATGIKDRNLKVTYIGDAVSGAEEQAIAAGDVPTMAPPTCILSPEDNRAIRISVDVGNNGQAPTQFHIAFDVAFGNKVFEDVQRAGVVADGATVPIYVDVPNVEGDCGEVTQVSATLIDPSTSLTTETWTPAWSDAGAASGSDWFIVDPSKESFRPSDAIVITYAGDLVAKKGNTPGETLDLVVKDGAGVTQHSASTTVPKSNQPWEFPSFSLGVGTYTVLLSRSSGETVADTLEVTASAPGNYIAPGGSANPPSGHTYQPSAVTEVEFLDELVYRFCPYVWDSKTETPVTPSWTPATWDRRCNGDIPAHSAEKDALAHYGDVFPDDKKLLGDQLHRRLSPGGVASLDIVNTLVIGSNVDHNTMTSNAVKGAIRDWVVDAGGTLIVFGSDKQVVNWLNPIFKTKLDSSSNGLSAPDADHPVLRVADDLPWDQYDDRGRAWELKEDDDDKTAKSFTKVVHDNSAEKNAILAISDPGAYGHGTVILTSWLPYDLFNDGSTDGGLFFVNNLLMQGYRDLFLDYGPSIPPNVHVVPAAGAAQVWHPELERHIALTVNVYVFPS